MMRVFYKKIDYNYEKLGYGLDSLFKLFYTKIKKNHNFIIQ